MRLGSPVKLIGIQSRTEVNGQHGVLIDMNANGRYCIRLRSGETMAVRPECCDPVLERAPSEIAVPKFDSLTKPKLNAPTIDLGALTAEAREVYSAIYAGEAIILRTEQKQTRGWLGSELADVTMFVITVDVGSWANLFSAAIVIPSKGPINSTTQWLATTDAAGIPIPTPFDRNGEPLAQLDKRLRDQIGYRILHLALRSVPVPQDVWFHSFKQLQNYYKQQSRWKDLANMYCLTIEVSCVLPGLARKVIDQPSHQRRIAKLEHDLGEALESLAKYEVAAEMYEEAASLFPAGAYERDHAIHDAGLARRRAYQCDRAEQLYHTALHSRVSHGDDVSTLFTWFKDLSAAYNYACNDQGECDPQLLGLAHTLGALLAAAGHPNKLGIAGNLIRPELRKELAARHALRRIASVEFDDLRRTILDCMTVLSPGESIGLPVLANMSQEQRVQLDKACRRDAAGAARKSSAVRTQERDGTEHPVSASCSFCGKDPGPYNAKYLSKCPCGTAQYCDKTCQKSHWKVHKTTCAAKRA